MEGSQLPLGSRGGGRTGSKINCHYRQDGQNLHPSVLAAECNVCDMLHKDKHLNRACYRQADYRRGEDRDDSRWSDPQ